MEESIKRHLQSFVHTMIFIVFKCVWKTGTKNTKGEKKIKSWIWKTAFNESNNKKSNWECKKWMSVQNGEVIT